MISRSLVLRLGLGQLIGWGATYYLVGVFAPRIAADLGWSLSAVQGGFSVGLLAMALASPAVGRAIDRHGGRAVMTAGSLVGAAGCAGLALAHGPWSYCAAWVVIGVAMRLMLYDAAFAALARIGGRDAKAAMAQITLLGGLASTVFWPLGDALADAFGWRGAVTAYALICAASALLHIGIPNGRHAAPAPDPKADAPEPVRRGSRRAAVLYAIAVALVSALNSAMSAHMIGILAALGLPLQAAVWIAALRGFGQTGARGCEVLFGARLSAVDLNLLAALMLPLGFAAAFGAPLMGAAAAFALLFGAGNGLSTITRGTLPLALFDPATYGSLVGRLIAPSFLLSAGAPVAYALVIERWGSEAALWLSLALAGGALAAAIGLKASAR
ncbi:MFS transporter [Chenggangzhangella methanolivorans]|uniref:MFS transporter n=1 Tax=Chenggangzhangella methanolivorans TaxID=1437009 RepID=A0A9E6RB02_9HYPH|nr:MFS transporter [Chenggangzhangella methanolivorans]QZO00882.1 MFS transporter [Chenggangzhangella methanolivorans]